MNKQEVQKLKDKVYSVRKELYDLIQLLNEAEKGLNDV